MINYQLLNESLIHHETNGFKRIETPWTVSQYVDDITRPSDRQPFELKHNDKRLVASGEQSFLYLYLKGFLPMGQYQTITPCYRNESFDNLHSKYFMKNELIKTDDVSTTGLNIVLDSALSFYRKYFSFNDISLQHNGYDYDILLKNKFELGSYGIRTCDFLTWIYGTGCAEPRTSNLIRLYGVNEQLT